MTVSTTEYGNLYTLEGTLAEVMAELKGVTRSNIIAVAYDAGNSKFAAIVSH